MDLPFRPLHPVFVAEAGPIDLRAAEDESTLQAIRAGMDRYAVLVFRDQRFTPAEQLAFTERFDGRIHRATSQAAVSRNRYGDEAFTDIGNVDEHGEPMPAQDRRRMNNLANRLWHADATFVDPCGRYSLLYARVVPPEGADTEFCDTRAAYDALDDRTRASLEGLRVFHSIVHSRSTLGFEFSEAERQRLPGAVQPLVREIPGAGRRSLHLASHAAHVLDMPVPEGRLLLRDLMEWATQARFVYRHAWREGDLVIWDNRATMHRATPFDDRTHRRELIRTTTLDLPRAA